MRKFRCACEGVGWCTIAISYTATRGGSMTSLTRVLITQLRNKFFNLIIIIPNAVRTANAANVPNIKDNTYSKLTFVNSTITLYRKYVVRNTISLLTRLLFCEIHD